MNTREMAAEYRLSHWAGIMRDRQESGQSIRAYCRQSGIHENVYYYWQRKLREAACEELAERATLQQSAPVGWALCPKETVHTENSSTMQSAPGAPDQIVVEAGALRLVVGREYPAEQLALLLQGLMR